MMRRRFEWLLLISIAACAGLALAVEDRVVAAAFSAMPPGTAPPAGWTPLTVASIKNRTQYTLVSDGSVTVLRAEVPPVKAIAIATDTDNTGADATAYFGDIIFYKQILTNISPGKSAAP